MKDSKYKCPFMKLKNEKKTSCPVINTKVSKNECECPFNKLKNEKITPCPVINTLINMGKLNPNIEWSKKYVRNALKTIKMSDLLASLITDSTHKILKENNLNFTVKSLQKHNVIEHDASFSRDDCYLGNSIIFNKKRFNLIFKYFKDKKKITLKEFTEYRYYLYKKSLKENSEFVFGSKQFYSTLAQTCAIFILLSNDDQLNLHKLQKVVEEENLKNVNINSINVLNFSVNFIKSILYWFMASLR